MTDRIEVYKFEISIPGKPSLLHTVGFRVNGGVITHIIEE